ncbi:MAG: ATP-binding protein [Thermomicrobiales bacterium]
MRLLLPFLISTVLVLLLLSLFLGNRARDIYITRLEDELHTQAILLADDAGRGLETAHPDADVRKIVADLSTMMSSRLTIVGSDGWVIADSEADPATMENHGNRPEVIQARAVGLGESERRSATIDEDFLYVAVPIEQSPGAVARVAVSIHDVDVVIARIQRYIMAAAAAAILLAVAASWFISGRIARPLDKLRHQALAVAGGDFTSRVEPDGTQEIGDLGRAFNAMTSELQAQVATIERTGTRLEAVMAGLADGVILTDVQGKVIRLNRAAERMLETDEAAATGRPFVQVVRDHDLAGQLREALEGQDQLPVTIEHGLNRMILQASAQIVTGSQERLGLVVLRDITRLRQLELVRREFVANVSHELRTPLTSIRALTETLEAGAIEDRQMTADFLARILGEVDRLTALVEDLLDMARLEAGRAPLEIAMVDPGELVQRGADRLRPQVERARLTLTVKLGEHLVPVPADRSRIEQVLLNLVHNAIKFTPAGGAITIGVGRESDVIVTTVSDTGVGIPESEQARLFERFYKSDKARHSTGTGLGLAIAKHIVRLHGGEISVESNPGSGATFRFTLPIDPVARSGMESIEAIEHPDRG